MLSRDGRLFFLRWLSSPFYYGSPLPSGKKLASAMAAQLSAVGPEEYIVELGPGSGVVTRALCEAGVDQKRLFILERDYAFIDSLKKEFPHSIVVQEDATNLKEILEKHGIKQVAAVVSSLPLLSIPDKARELIVHAVFKILKPSGVLIQYTYGLHSPVPKRHQKAIGISGNIAKRVWRNLPPARVWCYTAESRA